jgi:hypothetical protein
VDLNVGQVATLVATPRDVNGNTLSGRPVSWNSSAPNVATVSVSGVVTALTAGTTDITATIEGVNARRTVTVTARASTVSIAPSSAILTTVGQTASFSATARDAAGNLIPNRNIQWTSSNVAVGTIASSGLLTAVSAGSTTVSANVDGVTATASVLVAPVYTLAVTTSGVGAGLVTVSPQQTSYAAGSPVTLTAIADAFSYFAGWSGSCAGNTLTCMLTMSQNRIASASFGVQQWVGSFEATYNVVRRNTSSVGGSCTWTNTLTNGRITITPITGTSGSHIVSVFIQYTYDEPAGTPSVAHLNCLPRSGTYSLTLMGPVSSNGSFILTAQPGSNAWTVTGSLSGTGIGGSINVKYNEPDGTSVSGSALITYLASPTKP